MILPVVTFVVLSLACAGTVLATAEKEEKEKEKELKPEEELAKALARYLMEGKSASSSNAK